MENAIGDNNTALGELAGYGTWPLARHSNNVFLGSRSAMNITSGSNNVAVGYRAGYYMTGASNNILIGYDVQAMSNY